MATQKMIDGLYELTEESRKELSSSKYWNEDIAPTSVAARTWNTYNIAMLWVGMSICIPSFMMASGCVGMGLPVWAAVFNVILGNALILVPIALNSFAGTKYGIAFPAFARMSFGVRGAQIPALSRAITACGWCAVQCLTAGGPALLYIVMAFNGHNDITGNKVAIWIGFLIFLAMTWALTAFGERIIRIFEAIGSPILIVMAVALFIWAIVIAGNAGHSFGDVFTTNFSDTSAIAANGGYFMVFCAGLMGNIAFWATMALNIPDFSRYAKTQKAQLWGQIWGMPFAMAGCAIVGAFFAQATLVANTKGDGTPMFSPTEAIGAVAGPGAGGSFLLIILGLGVIIATLTTNIAANVVAPGNGFSNIAPKKISYFWGVTIACLVAILYAFPLTSATAAGGMYTFLNIYGGILAPLAAIFIVDYWIVKKKNLDVKGLFTEGEQGRYWYNAGFNVQAFIAWIAGSIIPTLASLIPSFGALPVISQINGSFSYVFAFAVAFIIYLAIGKLGASGKAIMTDEEEAALTEK